MSTDSPMSITLSSCWAYARPARRGGPPDSTPHVPTDRPVEITAGIVSARPRGWLFSVLGEDADGVVPVEAVADPTSGGRVGGDVGVVVFDGSRRVAELRWVDVVGRQPPVGAPSRNRPRAGPG
jgi:hypothetical protein